jgi:hypothetical protein
MRISATQRTQNETRIRAAIDRLLNGQIPAGGRCDIKTLACEANVDRTAFYGNRPYAHLRAEFEQRVQARHAAGEVLDARDNQITRLKNQVHILTERIADRDQQIAVLADAKAQALSRLAAQHEEIARLRRQSDLDSAVRRLPVRTSATGPCS